MAVLWPAAVRMERSNHATVVFPFVPVMPMILGGRQDGWAGNSL